MKWWIRVHVLQIGNKGGKVKAKPSSIPREGKNKCYRNESWFKHLSSRSFALVPKKASTDFFGTCRRQPYTLWCCYNNFLTNIHRRHGWDMGVCFVGSASDDLPQFLQRCVQYHVILDRNITTLNCIAKWLLWPIMTFMVVHSRNVLLDTNVILNQMVTSPENHFGLICNGIVIETTMQCNFWFSLQAPQCRSE